MSASFIFGGDTGETPQTLEAKRTIAQALALRAMSDTPKNAGEGLSAIGKALAYRAAMGNYTDAAIGAQKDYGGIVDSLVSGGGAAPSAAAPAATPAPSQPQIPAAAFSGGNLTDTPAPLSGGLPQASASPSLTDAVAKLESGNSSNEGPSGRYVNYRFQQFPAFAKQYGTGADGVLNYAKRVLASNPNATFGDMYGGYVTGTGNPATASIDSLKTTTQPGAQGAYGNLVRNSPIDPKTPLSQLIASNDPNFVPQPAGGMNPQLSALLSPNMTVGQGAFSPPASPPPASGPAMAFNGQPPANPLATPPQANGFAPSPQGQPNITTLQTKPAAMPIEGQPQAGRAAVAQALSNQPSQTPTAASTIPPNVAATIKRALMSASPQAQALGTGLLQKYMQPRSYGFTMAPDGTLLRTDSLAGTVAPVYQGGQKPTTEQLNYQYYLRTIPQGQQPMDFATWSTAKAKASAAQVNNNIDMGGPQSYDKQLAEGLAKSHASLSNGVEEAQSRARDIAAMQGAIDQIQKNGGTTGGMGQEQVLALKKTINSGAAALGITNPFAEGDISDKEFLQKFNRQMAGAQAKGAVGARVTNFEMSNFLKSNPGLDMSITGNQRLLGIQAQIERRNIAVGNQIRQATAQAISQGKRIDPMTVQKLITDYDQQHHITDPVTGQDLTQSYTLPEFQTGGTNPQKAQQHGQNIDDLVKKYGGQ